MSTDSRHRNGSNGGGNGHSNGNAHGNGHSHTTTSVTGLSSRAKRKKGTLPAPYEKKLQAIDEQRASIHDSLEIVIDRLDQELKADKTSIPVAIDEEDEDSLVIRINEALPALKR